MTTQARAPGRTQAPSDPQAHGRGDDEGVQPVCAERSAASDRSIVLVGLMGVGKTSVGKRLAARLGWDFVDADSEIENAAGRSVSEIFADFGEAAFRDGERKVIARILSSQTPLVLATGGGAFVDAQTRALVLDKAISVWLDAPTHILVERTGRRKTRPLLRTGDPHEILSRLARERTPFYQQADIRIESSRGPAGDVVENILRAIGAVAAPDGAPDGAPDDAQEGAPDGAQGV